MNKDIAVAFLLSLIRAREGQTDIELKEANDESVDDQM